MDQLDQPLGALPKAAADKDKSGCCTAPAPLRCLMHCIRFFYCSVHDVFSHWNTDKCTLCSLVGLDLSFSPFTFQVFAVSMTIVAQKCHLVVETASCIDPAWPDHTSLSSHHKPSIFCLFRSFAANMFVYSTWLSWARLSGVCSECAMDVKAWPVTSHMAWLTRCRIKN